MARSFEELMSNGMCQALGFSQCWGCVTDKNRSVRLCLWAVVHWLGLYSVEVLRCWYPNPTTSVSYPNTVPQLSTTPQKDHNSSSSEESHIPSLGLYLALLIQSVYHLGTLWLQVTECLGAKNSLKHAGFILSHSKRVWKQMASRVGSAVQQCRSRVSTVPLYFLSWL